MTNILISDSGQQNIKNHPWKIRSLLVLIKVLFSLYANLKSFRIGIFVKHSEFIWALL